MSELLPSIFQCANCRKVFYSDEAALLLEARSSTKTKDILAENDEFAIKCPFCGRSYALTDGDELQVAQQTAISITPLADQNKVIAGLDYWYHTADENGTLSRIGGETAVVPLIQILNMRLEKYSVSAAGVLGKLRAKMAIPSLIKALRDPNQEDQCRQRVADSLGAIADTSDVEAVGALIWALTESEVPKDFGSSYTRDIVRCGVARALGEIGGQHAAEALALALSEPESEDSLVRCYAMSSLGKLGDVRAVDPIVKWFDANDRYGSHGDSDVQLKAKVLLEIGGEEGLRALRKAWKNGKLKDCLEPVVYKQPREIQVFITGGIEKKKGCLVATAACGSAAAPAVRTLSDFRDTVLEQHYVGRYIIKKYNSIAPPLARWIEPRQTARWLVRTVLVVPLASAIRRLRR